MFASNYDYGGGAVLAALFVTYLVLFILLIAFYVISAIFYNKLFAKAGVQGKWRGWVPVYREMIFAKLGDLSPWPVLGVFLTWIPFLGWLVSIAVAVYLILAAYRIGQKLQKEGAWVVLYVLLSIVWLGVVAYDKSVWRPNIAPAPWAGNFLADKTVWQGIPIQPAAVAGPPAPGGYAPPPPAGYAPPPPAGYTPPPASGYTPPPPPPTTQPPSSDQPPRV